MAEGGGAGAAALLNREALQQKLRTLNSSQQSIESTANWCTFYSRDAKGIVAAWEEEFARMAADKKLTQLYLANHLVQGKKRIFADEFARVVPRAVKDLVRASNSDTVRGKVERLIDVWETRRVFGSSVVKALREALQAKPKGATSSKNGAGAAGLGAGGSGRLHSADLAGAGSVDLGGSNGTLSSDKLQALGPLAELMSEVSSAAEKSSQHMAKAGQLKPNLAGEGSHAEVTVALEVLSGCVVALEADVTVRQRAIQEIHKQLQRQNEGLRSAQQQLKSLKEQQQGVQGRLHKLMHMAQPPSSSSAALNAAAPAGPSPPAMLPPPGAPPMQPPMQQSSSMMMSMPHGHMPPPPHPPMQPPPPFGAPPQLQPSGSMGNGAGRGPGMLPMHMVPNPAMPQPMMMPPPGFMGMPPNMLGGPPLGPHPPPGGPPPHPMMGPPWPHPPPGPAPPPMPPHAPPPPHPPPHQPQHQQQQQTLLPPPPSQDGSGSSPSGTLLGSSPQAPQLSPGSSQQQQQGQGQQLPALFPDGPLGHLVADQATAALLVQALAALPEEERQKLVMNMGPSAPGGGGAEAEGSGGGSGVDDGGGGGVGGSLTGAADPDSQPSSLGGGVQHAGSAGADGMEEDDYDPDNPF